MQDNLQKSDNQYHALRPSWDETWMETAKIIAKRSLCSRASVGAVIVDERNRPISMGYNGPPANFDHKDKWCSSWCKRGAIPIEYQKTGVIPDGAYDDCPSLHAEQNALITADKANFTGGTIYVSSAICGICAKLIANSGLKRVVIYDDGTDRDYRDSSKWCLFLKNLNIQITIIEYKDPLILRG